VAGGPADRCLIIVIVVVRADGAMLLALAAASTASLVAAAAGAGGHAQVAFGTEQLPPLQPTPKPAPCVQLRRFPEVVVISFRNTATARAFKIWREPVGESREGPSQRNMSKSEVEKCADKGHCTFHDRVTPGDIFLYYITATSSGGSSRPTQILCATQPRQAPQEPAAAVGGLVDSSSCIAGGVGRENPEDGKERMDIGASLGLCMLAFLLGAALTALVMYRAVLSGDRWVVEQLGTTAAGAGGGGILGVWLGWRSPSHSGGGGGGAAAAPLWMWWPLHTALLPALRRMERQALVFTGAMAEQDLDGDGVVSLAELQHGCRAPRIVADDIESFEASWQEWARKAEEVHWEMRLEVESIMDGTPVLQPVLLLAYTAGSWALCYVLALLCRAQEWWGGYRAVARYLEYRDLRRPGCWVWVYMLPLLVWQLAAGWAVIVSAMQLAQNMSRNVKQLQKIENKLKLISHSTHGHFSIQEKLISMYTQPTDKRWGIKLCGVTIDSVFWEFLLARASPLLLLSLLLVPVIQSILIGLRAKREKAKESAARARMDELRRKAEAATREREAQLLIAHDARWVDWSPPRPPPRTSTHAPRSPAPAGRIACCAAERAAVGRGVGMQSCARHSAEEREAASRAAQVSHNGQLLRRRARHVPATAPQ
jgi:hypothetical protein